MYHQYSLVNKVWNSFSLYLKFGAEDDSTKKHSSVGLTKNSIENKQASFSEQGEG